MSNKPKQNLSSELSHLKMGEGGRAEACMVDIGSKSSTARSALAGAYLVFPAGCLAAVRSGRGSKGSLEAIFETARTAAILAAKRTGDLIPMCHPLSLDFVEVSFREVSADSIEVRCRASNTGKTGVEMEALCAASVAALTIFDMTKAMAKGIRIESLELLEKSGGKSGRWQSERF